MKHCIATAFALAVLAFPVGVLAQGKQNFTLVNKTAYDISEVYVSPHNTDEWEEDVLGKDILEEGDEVEISFQRGTSACMWDLKVVYDDDDSSSEWESIDLCKVSEVTIRYNRPADETSATFK